MTSCCVSDSPINRIIKYFPLLHTVIIAQYIGPFHDVATTLSKSVKLNTTTHARKLE